MFTIILLSLFLLSSFIYYFVVQFSFRFINFIRSNYFVFFCNSFLIVNVLSNLGNNFIFLNLCFLHFNKAFTNFSLLNMLFFSSLTYIIVFICALIISN
uniref:Uncharacterized protein n=1 Tax=Panstrongylus lignarius TaxID=156445 RepID=A0A224XQX3_9HEMI